MVVGMKRSGVAAAELLLRHGAEVRTTDLKPLEELPEARALGAPFAVQSEAVFEVRKAVTENQIAEVEQHLGEGRVKCVAMEPTEGMVRGMKAIDTGGPITVPVGPGPASPYRDVLSTFDRPTAEPGRLEKIVM